MRPKRSNDKYWNGTRNFNHLQYESDLEDYISDLEVDNDQLRNVINAEASKISKTKNHDSQA